MQLVMAVAACVTVVPLVLTSFLDLGRLQRWAERARAEAQQGFCSSQGCLEEPLLPKDEAEGGRGGVSGHDILVEDAAMGHWEADAAAAFSVQAATLIRETTGGGGDGGC